MVGEVFGFCFSSKCFSTLKCERLSKIQELSIDPNTCPESNGTVFVFTDTYSLHPCEAIVVDGFVSSILLGRNRTKV
jgi:hypothetical protein